MATRLTIEQKIAALQAEITELEQKRDAESKHLEQAKTFADAFIKKLEKDGIDVKVGLRAYCDLAKLTMPKSPAAGASKTRAKRGEVAPKLGPAYEPGARYANPANKDEIYPKLGKEWKWAKRPDWMVAIVPNDMPHDQAVAAYKRIKVSGGDHVNNG